MIRHDLLGALMSAMARGETLKQATMTLENAGYKSEEIQLAVKTFQQQKIPVEKAVPAKESVLKKPLPPPKPKNAQRVSNYSSPKPMPKPKPVLKKVPIKPVSEYASPVMDHKRKVIIFILGVVLVILFGVLIGLFVYKSAIIEFFNLLFG